MNSLLLIIACLTGPPGPEGKTPFKIHLGRDRQSAIIRSEWNNTHQWFTNRRIEICHRFQVTIDDDALNFPTYSIGDGRARLRFPEGTFAASGTFMYSLQDVGDGWIVANADYSTNQMV